MAHQKAQQGAYQNKYLPHHFFFIEIEGGNQFKKQTYFYYSVQIKHSFFGTDSHFLAVFVMLER